MIIQSLYSTGEQKKKKTPSQVAAEQNKTSGGIKPIYGADSTYQYVPPKPQVQPKPIQQPQNDNISKAVDAIRNTAETAIKTLTGTTEPISPIPQKDLVKTKPYNPINDVQIPLGGGLTFGQVGNVIDTIRKTVNPALTDFATGGVVSNKNQVAPRKEYKTEADYQKALKESTTTTLSDTINRDFGLGISGIIQGATGGILKPKKVKLTTVDQKVTFGVADVLGSVATIKAISSKLEGVISNSTTLGNLISKLPKPVSSRFIKYASNVLGLDIYGQLDPDVKDRLSQLAQSTVLGTLFSATGGSNAAISIPANFGIGFGLAKINGASNEDAFISGGILSVLDASQRAKGALLKSQFKEGNLTMTPDEIRTQANSTNFKDTPAQEILNKAADQAQTEGKDVKINLQAAQKSKAAKIFNAKTPEGFSFSLELVDKKGELQLIKQEGASQQTQQPTDTSTNNVPTVVSQELNKSQPTPDTTLYRGISPARDPLSINTAQDTSYGKGVYLFESPQPASDFNSNVAQVNPTQQLNLYTPTEAERKKILSLKGAEKDAYIKTLLGDTYNGLRIVKPSDYQGTAGAPEVVVYDTTLLKVASTTNPNQTPTDNQPVETLAIQTPTKPKNVPDFPAVNSEITQQAQTDYQKSFTPKIKEIDNQIADLQKKIDTANLTDRQKFDTGFKIQELERSKSDVINEWLNKWENNLFKNNQFPDLTITGKDTASKAQQVYEQVSKMSVDPYKEQLIEQAQTPDRFHTPEEAKNPKGIKIGDKVLLKDEKFGDSFGYVVGVMDESGAPSYQGGFSVQTVSPFNYGGATQISDVELIKPNNQRQEAVTTPTAEPNLPEISPALQEKANADWENNYADKVAKIDEQLIGLRKQLETANSTDKIKLEKRIEDLNNQLTKNENDFIAKWQSKAKTPAPKINKTTTPIKQPPQNIANADIVKIFKVLNKKNYSLPILQSVSVKDGILTSTNLDISVQTRTSLKDGLYELVGKDIVPSKFVDTKDYPDVAKEIEKVKDETAQILSGKFKDALDVAKNFISTEDSRYALTGAYLEFSKGKLLITTTDAYKLNHQEVSVSLTKDSKFIVSSIKDLSNLFEIFGDSKISIKENKEFVSFSNNQTTILAKKITGNFPEYSKVSPSYEKQIQVDTKSLNEALKEVLPYVKDNANIINLELKDNKLEITGKSSERTKVIPLDVTTKDISFPAEGVYNGTLIMPVRTVDEKGKYDNKISLNVKYLQDALKAISTDKSSISLNLDKGAFTLRTILVTDLGEKPLNNPDIANAGFNPLTATIEEQNSLIKNVKFGTGEFKVGDIYTQKVAQGQTRPVVISKVNPDGSVEGFYAGAISPTEKSFGISPNSLQPAKWNNPKVELQVPQSSFGQAGLYDTGLSRIADQAKNSKSFEDFTNKGITYDLSTFYDTSILQQEADRLLSKPEMTATELKLYKQIGDLIDIVDNIDIFTKEIAKAQKSGNTKYIKETRPIVEKNLAKFKELQSQIKIPKIMGKISGSADISVNGKTIALENIGQKEDTKQVFIERARTDLTNLIKIPGGSVRDVYDLGNDYVVKIANSPKGLEQNTSEGDYYLENELPRVIEYGLDYVIVEKADKNLSKAKEFLKPLEKFSTQDFENKTSELQDAFLKMGMESFMDYNLLWNDFIAPRNWGINKKGDFVLVDAGAINKDVTFSSKPEEWAVSEWRQILQARKDFLRTYRITGKYPPEIYKAYNVAFSSSLTAQQIDQYSYAEVKQWASQGLSGGEQEFDKLVPKPKEPKITTNASAGDFADIANRTSEMQNFKVAEFPELVQLAKDLLGDYPQVRLPRYRPSLGGRPNGLFIGVGKGKIILNPNIFKDPQQAPKTLAHEIGHLTDYLPEGTLTRGNLLGRLNTLNKFMHGTFGDLTNKEIKTELINLGQLWKPFDPTESKEFTKYRYSAPELYADAISVLFNDPEMLKQEAPLFWRSFFDNLDKKPEAKDNFFKLWDLLNKGEETVLSERDKLINEMFQRGEDLIKIKHEENKLKKQNYLFRLKVEFVDKNSAIIKKIDEARKNGVEVNPDDDPRLALDELNYVGGVQKEWLQSNIQPIYHEMFNAGITWEDFGQALFLTRVMDERAQLANPLGFDPKTAEAQLEFLKRKLGIDKFAIVEKNLEPFREAIKIWTNEAKGNYYSEDLVNDLIQNKTYATFQVLDYMGVYLTPRVRKQIGTLKEISNPATAMVEKTLNLIKQVEKNKAKIKTVDFLKANFAPEILDAQTVFNGKTKIPVEPKDRNLELLTVMENGKYTGYYVDPYIALSFNTQGIGHQNAIIESIKFLKVHQFQPLFITFNLGFQTFNFARDLFQAIKAEPSKSLLVSAAKVLGGYVKAAPIAYRRAFDKYDVTISKMEKEKIFGFTYNDVLRGRTSEDKQIDYLMKKADLPGLTPEKKTILKKVLTPASAILQLIERTGNFIETLPKVGAYVRLDGKLPDKELAQLIRTSVGSPDFLAGGTGRAWFNAVFLYANPFIQGSRASYNLAFKNPRTRSGYWWKTAQLNILPKLLMFAALYGLFGDKIKQMMKNVSEYDMANYNIIPLFLDESGNTGYVRIPQDETGRLVSALVWKTLDIFRKDNNQDAFNNLADLFSVGAGQFPNVNPAITSFTAALQYMGGQNPYDYFRNRNVLPDTTFKAGFRYSLMPFLTWEFQTLGGGIFLKTYVSEQAPTNKSWGQKVLEAPFLSNVIGRWFKISNYGQTEANYKIQDKIQQENAQQNIETKKTLNAAITDYMQGNHSITRKVQIQNQLVKDVIGVPKTSEQKAARTRLIKKFQLGIIKGEADPTTSSLIDSNSNATKIEILKQAKESLGDKYHAYLKDMVRQKVISAAVYKASY